MRGAHLRGYRPETGSALAGALPCLCRSGGRREQAGRAPRAEPSASGNRGWAGYSNLQNPFSVGMSEFFAIVFTQGSGSQERHSLCIIGERIVDRKENVVDPDCRKSAHQRRVLKNSAGGDKDIVVKVLGHSPLHWCALSKAALDTLQMARNQFSHMPEIGR